MKHYKLVKELTLKVQSRERVSDYVLNSPATVYSFLREKIADEAQENLVTLNLNTKNELQSWNLTSKGTVNEAIVHPREIFKHSIISNASSIVIAHNHPSGNINPSDGDIETTKRIEEAGNLIGIPLLDHIIVTVDGYLSMREQGYI